MSNKDGYSFKYCMTRKCNSCRRRGVCEEGEKKYEKRVNRETEKVRKRISKRF